LVAPRRPLSDSARGAPPCCEAFHDCVINPHSFQIYLYHALPFPSWFYHYGNLSLPYGDNIRVSCRAVSETLPPITLPPPRAPYRSSIAPSSIPEQDLLNYIFKSSNVSPLVCSSSKSESIPPPTLPGFNLSVSSLELPPHQ